MDYVTKVKEWKKKTIKRIELEELFSLHSDENLYVIVNTLVEQNVLLPIKRSQTNGNRLYPIYNKYKIVSSKEIYEAELEEINTLHTTLLKNGYLQDNPEEYKTHREMLRKLDLYLFEHSDLGIPISRKERSFEIFDEEKMLDNKTFCILLSRIGLNSSTLRYYDTPEYCFNDYIPEKKQHMTLLISENKDTWFNLRRMMFENKATTIFGTKIDGVVYGCGNMISGKGALTAYTSFIDSDVDYLYWGDIDRAGLNIYLSTVRNNPDLNVRLFVPAYEAMLKMAQTRNIPNSQDKREHMDDYETIFKSIASNLQQTLRKNIADNKRIPQEIISYAYLKNTMR